MKTWNFIQRIFAAPFLFALMVLRFNFEALRRTWLFLKYGGEFIHYQKNDRESGIKDIFEFVKEKYNEQNK